MRAFLKDNWDVVVATLAPVLLALALTIVTSLFGCHGVDVDAHVRPVDPNKVEPAPKPAPYDWEPWWNRKPKR